MKKNKKTMKFGEVTLLEKEGQRYAPHREHELLQNDVVVSPILHSNLCDLVLEQVGEPREVHVRDLGVGQALQVADCFGGQQPGRDR